MATTTHNAGRDTARLAVSAFYRSFYSDPLLNEFFGDTYANFGYWDAPFANGKAACDRLVDVSVHGIDPTGVHDVLDVACGRGGSTARLRQCFPDARVTATGVDSTQLAHAQALVPEACFHCAVPTALPFPADKFDVVSCYEAAFHFESRADFFAEALRVLRPGGVLVLSDLLFVRGVPFMPAENHLQNTRAYDQALLAAGFSGVRTTDITQPGWRSFRRQLNRYLLRYPANSLAIRDRLAANTFWSLVMRYNLMARAVKPDPDEMRTTGLNPQGSC